MNETIVIRYETHPDAADENQRLIEDVFAELQTGNPDGLRYASFRLADGVSFMHIAVVEGTENPLFSIPAFQRFTRTIGERLSRSPVQQDATLIGSYRFPQARPSVAEGRD
ncbi:hypothetical protein SMC26_35595 [Actinomadura fulvescens]|uniref:Antibiotic biosynthesis monooxygenase n=1 Tax=Actinomadura fulvescens TaxID=46160 RepID=A0ABP6CY15_9ACTN